MSRPKLLHTLASLTVIFPIALIAQFSTANAASGPLSAGQVSVLSQGTTHRYVVILNNQHKDLSGRIHATARVDAIASDEKPVVAELNQLMATNVYAYHVASMVRGTFTAAEAANLSANPMVKAVVPDKVVPMPRLVNGSDSATPATTPGAPTQSSSMRSHIVAGPQAPQTGASACSDTSDSSLGAAQLEPESLQVDHTAYQNSSTQQAANLVDGTGVTVAILADGMDTNNPDLMRNGNPVITQYTDFTGEGLAYPAEGIEAFLDSSSIAAQASQVYDVSSQVSSAFKNNTYPWLNHTHCYIKIRGVAPGANIMYEKVFPNGAGQYDSILAEGVDYAATHGADVINESYGGNVYPDTGNDPNAVANDGAVAAGKVVVESTGDAGTENTISAESTDPNVIAAGATTTERSQSQTGSPAVPPSTGTEPTGYTGGYISNNIASLSSTGISEAGNKTVDTVAAGDLGWILCSPYNPGNNDFVYGCGSATFTQSGGTSMSAPLTSGEAALVIAAYREAHQGLNPSPLLVKQIIKGTDTNLGAPADQQGAGMDNTLAAVQAALGYPDDNGPQQSVMATIDCSGEGGSPPVDCPASMIYSTTAQAPNNADMFSATGATSQTHNFQYTVTNAGTSFQVPGSNTETVTPSNAVLGGSTVNHYQMNFNSTDTGPIIKNSSGSSRIYQVLDFSVGSTQAASCDSGLQSSMIEGYQAPVSNPNHLTVAVAWPQQDQVTSAPTNVRLLVYDPNWNFIGWSDPQGGIVYYGEQTVTNPGAGCWHALVYLNPTHSGGPPAWQTNGSGQAPFSIDVYQASFQSTGTDSGSQTIPAGQTELFTAALPAPASAGDEAAGIRLNNGAGKVATIPVVLRSRVDENLANEGSRSAVGDFSGDLRGGNGRGGSPGQVFTYEFNVPTGLHDLALRVLPFDGAIHGSCLSDIEGVLVDPNGTPVDMQSDYPSPCDFLQLFRRDPMPGNWKFIMLINTWSAGTSTDIPFLGQLFFDYAAPQIAPVGLPNGGTIPAGHTVTANINITNPSSIAYESFFVDTRNTAKTQNLSLAKSSSLLSATAAYNGLNYFVPPETSDISLHAESMAPKSVPIISDIGDVSGAYPTGTLFSPISVGTTGWDSLLRKYTTDDNYSAPEVPSGQWYGAVFEAAPFPASGQAPNPMIRITITGATQARDYNATSSSGVPWLPGFKPTVLYPHGAGPQSSGTISVKIRSVGVKGTVVRGTAYVDTYTKVVVPTGPTTKLTLQPQTVEEVLSFPYSYTVG